MQKSKDPSVGVIVNAIVVKFVALKAVILLNKGLHEVHDDSVSLTVSVQV